ncbi:hypothetical protein [Clostridium saccharobutylicum]|nr:hypothetical protein [Clostridium saccharobutylicum]MBC2436942.1 hypothetical protein [Clostridium saccharobutylicum]
MYDSILSKEGTSKYITYKTIIALALQMNSKDIECMEIYEVILSLEECLEKLVGEKLYKDKQKELVEFIELKDARGRLQKSIGQLNEYLVANKIPYIIKNPSTKTYRDETGKVKKEKSYWVIGKIIYGK